mgnify:CR=1 FL=1
MIWTSTRSWKISSTDRCEKGYLDYKKTLHNQYWVIVCRIGWCGEKSNMKTGTGAGSSGLPKWFRYSRMPRIWQLELCMESSRPRIIQMSVNQGRSSHTRNLKELIQQVKLFQGDFCEPHKNPAWRFKASHWTRAILCGYSQRTFYSWNNSLELLTCCASYRVDIPLSPTSTLEVSGIWECPVTRMYLNVVMNPGNLCLHWKY